MNQDLLQRHTAQQIEAAPQTEGLTQEEKTICKNLRLGLAIALSMSILLYVAEKISCS